MAEEGHVKAALQALHHPGTSAADRQAAQAYLLSFQRSPEAWRLLPPWIESPATDATLHLFALQTLQAKLLRDWETQKPEADDKQSLRTWLVGLLERHVGGQLSLAPAPRQKFYQAVVTLAIKAYPATWPDPIQDLLSLLAAHPAAVLRVLEVLPEEVARLPLPPSQRYAWSHNLAQQHAALLDALQHLPRDLPAAQAKLACLRTWLALASLPVSLILQDVQDSMQALHALAHDEHTEFWEVALDFLNEVVSSNSIEQTTVLGLASALLTLKPVLEDPNTLVAEAVSRVYVSLAESHCDSLFGSATDPDTPNNNTAIQFLQALLGLTGGPDMRISESTLNAWHLIHELAIEAGLPAGPTVLSLFSSLAQALLHKASPQSSPTGKSSEFEQYRRDLADCLLCCWRILDSAGLYPLLMSHLQASPDNLEVVLWAFEAVSEEVSQYHEIIGQLLASLPSMATLNPGLRSHAIRLFGRFAHLLSEQNREMLQGTVDLLLGELGAPASDLVTETNRLEAARSLHQINEDVPCLLVNRLDTLVALLPHLDPYPSALNLVSRTIGSVISDIPPSQRLPILSSAILSLKNVGHLTALLKATNLMKQPSDASDQSLPLYQFEQCPGLVGLFQQARSLIASNEYSATAPDTSANPPVLGCELLETLVVACGPAGFPLASPALAVLQQTLTAKPNPPALQALTTILCVYGQDRPGAMLEMLPPTMQAVLGSSDEDLFEELLNVLSKVGGKPVGIQAYQILQPPGLFDGLFGWISTRISTGGTASTPLLKAIVRFNVVLLGHRDSLWVDELYCRVAKPLLNAMLYALVNSTPRSQFDIIGRFLFELCQRFPQPSRQWIYLVLSQESYPSPRYSMEEKQGFMKALGACRSLGKCRQVVADFAQLDK